MSESACHDGKIILKNNQGADLFGNWFVQRKAKLWKKGLLALVQRYMKGTCGIDINLIGKLVSPMQLGSVNSKVYKA